MIGYRMTDFTSQVETYGKKVVIGVTNFFSMSNFRCFVAESLGPIVRSVCMPHADPKYSAGKLLGMAKRVCRETPRPDRRLLRKLRGFVRSWLRKNLVPLEPTEDLSFEHWLPQTNYSEARKAELQKCYVEAEGILKKEYLKVKAFVKDEFYPEWKHVRAIMARTDYYKCFAGPIFKAIEKKLFKLPHFVKYVEVSERPAYIMDRLFAAGGEYVATDYTAYESHFTRELMECCEFELYRYMLSLHTDSIGKNSILRVLLGMNQVEFKDCFFKFLASRMSGEMNTSLGNGFSNLMFMLFLCDQKGCEAVGVVEGDDGLFRVSGRCPVESDFAAIGLTIKMDRHRELNKAAFCKIIFDPIERTPVTNPLEVMTKFGWSKMNDVGMRHSRKALLLRAKAMSFLAQFPGCPVVQELCLYTLRCTPNVSNAKLEHFVLNSRSLDLYEKDKLLYGIRVPMTPRSVGLRTRLLVEEVYGVRIGDQHIIEAYLSSLTKIQPLDIDPTLFPQTWRDMGTTYTVEVPRHQTSEYLAANLLDLSKIFAQDLVKLSAKHANMLYQKGIYAHKTTE